MTVFLKRRGRDKWLTTDSISVIGTLGMDMARGFRHVRATVAGQAQTPPDSAPYAVRMCRYAMSDYRTHFVCTSCRRSFKHEPRSEQRCPGCRGPMVDAGRDLEVPRRGDVAGWRALAAVLDAGLTFHSCGCNGPGYRPRTPAAARQAAFASRR